MAAVTQQIPSVAAAIQKGEYDGSTIQLFGTMACQAAVTNAGGAPDYVVTVNDISDNPNGGGAVLSPWSNLDLTSATAALFVSLAIENLCPSELSAIPAGYPGAG